jgi:hypothetical protein
MFIGHFALGFGAKRWALAVSLGTLFLAAQFVDLLWPTLLLLGIEHVRVVPGITAFTPLDFTHYPVSHSLLAGVGWGIALGGGYALLRRNRRAAVVIGLLVLSHWMLDFVTHRPDLPILPGVDARAGLGLWHSIPATLVVELAIFAGGLALYARATAAVDRIGRWGLWALVAFLLAIYAANVWGPPPPDEAAIAWVDHAQWLLVLAAYGLDRHRAAVLQPYAG